MVRQDTSASVPIFLAAVIPTIIGLILIGMAELFFRKRRDAGLMTRTEYFVALATTVVIVILVDAWITRKFDLKFASR